MKNYVSTAAKQARKPSRKEVGIAKSECYLAVIAGGDIDECCNAVRVKYSLTGIERGIVRRFVLNLLDTSGLGLDDRGSGFLFLQRVPFSEFAAALSN